LINDFLAIIFVFCWLPKQKENKLNFLNLMIYTMFNLVM